MNWDLNPGLQTLNLSFQSFSIKSTPFSSLPGCGVSILKSPISFSTPFEFLGWDTPFRNASTLQISEKHRSLWFYSQPWIKLRWHSMTGVRIKLSHLQNQLKSGQTKPRKERPASAFLTRWPVCICVYIGDAHTPCLWLLTQSSMNNARVQKLSGAWGAVP